MHQLYILTIFTVLNAVFIVINISLIIHHKYWTTKKHKEYKELIESMHNDTKLILDSLNLTKTTLSTLSTEIKSLYE